MKKSHILIIKALLIFSVFPFLQGCLDTKARPENWLAKVGNDFITMDLFDKRLSQLPEEVKNQFQTVEQKNTMLQQLVNEQLLYQAAKDNKVDQSQSYKDAVSAAEEKLVSLKRQTIISEYIKNVIADKALKVEESEIQTFFNENPKQFASFERRKASHILVKTREEAMTVKSKLRKGASFDSLAMDLSMDPGTSKNGGDLGGWVMKGQLEKSFEDQLFAMKNIGDISPVVETKFGFHVIKLSDKQMVPQRKYEEVKPQIEQFLTVGKQRKELDSFVEKLKDTYKVETNENSFK